MGVLNAIASKDLQSYNKEQAMGQLGDNVIWRVERNLGLGLNEAVGWLVNETQKATRRLVEVQNQLLARHTSDSERDRAVRAYIRCAGNISRGNYEWGFECHRYFGSKGQEVRDAGWVELLLKVRSDVVTLNFDVDV